MTHLLASVTTAGWMRKQQEVREKNSECIHRRTWPLRNLKHEHWFGKPTDVSSRHILILSECTYLFPSAAEVAKQQMLRNTHKIQAKRGHHRDTGLSPLCRRVHVLCLTLGSFSSSSRAFRAHPGAFWALGSFPQFSQSSSSSPALLSTTWNNMEK